MMDLSVRQELYDELEKLTRSGRPSLDLQQFKKVKLICKYACYCFRTMNSSLHYRLITAL